jgi:uncharacterized protein YciI
MRGTLFTAVLMFSAFFTFGQSNNPKYDQALAESLGADDYGMKTYVLVILKTGSYNPEKKISDSLFMGHMQNIKRLADSGKLIVAGPMKKNDKNYRGIFILNAQSIEEGKLLVDSDPAVNSKLLEAEIFQWYGSAALPQYLKYHELVEKKKM